MKKLILTALITFMLTPARAVNVSDIDNAYLGYVQLQNAISEGFGLIISIQKLRGPKNDFTFYVGGSTFTATPAQKQEALAKYLGNLDKIQTIFNSMPR